MKTDGFLEERQRRNDRREVEQRDYQPPHNQPRQQQQQQQQHNPPRGQSQRRSSHSSHPSSRRSEFPNTQGPPPVLSTSSTSPATLLSTLLADLPPSSRVPEPLSVAKPFPGVPFLWPFSGYGLNFSMRHPNVPVFLPSIPHGEMSAEELRWSALQVGETPYVAAWHEAWATASLRKEAIVRAAPELIEMLRAENTSAEALEAVVQRELGFMRNAPVASMNAPFPANQRPVLHESLDAPFQSSPHAQTLHHPVHSQSASQLMGQSTGQPMGQSTSRSMGQSTGQLTHSTSFTSQTGSVFNFGEIPEVPPE